MDKERWGVHEHHCCVLHGCKYGYDDCPVELEQIKQKYNCEYCSDEGFNNVNEVIELIQLKDEVESKKLSNQEMISVSVDSLHRILSRI